MYLLWERGRLGALNAARCALNLILPHSQGATIGEHYLVKWFCKSCHEQRASEPPYDSSCKMFT